MSNSWAGGYLRNKLLTREGLKNEITLITLVGKVNVSGTDIGMPSGATKVGLGGPPGLLTGLDSGKPLGAA